MRTELVTTLKRQATEIMKQLEKDREPILITQHGVPSAYLVDVETFETLQRRMALLEGIARGEKAIEEGRSLTHKQAKQRMSRWLKRSGQNQHSTILTQLQTILLWTIPRQHGG